MKIVLDTNVLVSGILSPYGPCGEILRLVISGSVTLCVDSRILLEYEEVLQRPKFGLDHTQLLILLSSIENVSEKYTAPPLSTELPDPDDQAFIEVAHSAEVAALLTGNSNPFPEPFRHGIHVLTPREFMDAWRDFNE